MSYITPKKEFIINVFNINQNFFLSFFNLSGNSIYELPDNGL